MYTENVVITPNQTNKNINKNILKALKEILI